MSIDILAPGEELRGNGPSDEEIDEMEIEKQVSSFYEEPEADILQEQIDKAHGEGAEDEDV